MMRNAIKTFADQLAFEPRIENGKLKKYKKFILSGMGGSHLAADLARIYNPALPLIIRSDYGIPRQMSPSELKNSLFIASSYSGNTEEVIDSLEHALQNNMSAMVISVGGKLIEMAELHHLPYIQMPNIGLQPRSALGFSLKAIFKILGEEKALAECQALSHTLNPLSLEEEGKQLADRLHDHIPVIYSSRSNKAIAYNWKIKFNETGKIPAFYNVFPELNHNEMNGFDVQENTRALSEKFYFIILKDDDDHEKVLKRMTILEKLYKDRGLKVETRKMTGSNKLEKIFTSLLIADWTALHTANFYNLESEQVPMVEEFKNLIK